MCGWGSALCYREKRGRMRRSMHGDESAHASREKITSVLFTKRKTESIRTDVLSHSGERRRTTTEVQERKRSPSISS